LVFLLTPALVVMSFPCAVWCSSSALKANVRRRETARIQLTHVGAMATLQTPRTFVAENPLGSRAWSQPEVAFLCRRPFHWVRSDLCCHGLKGPTGMAMKRPTAFCTNSAELSKTLARACRGDHRHEVTPDSGSTDNCTWPLAAILADAVRPARQQEPAFDDQCFAPSLPKADGFTYWFDAASLKMHRQACFGTKATM
jgi:hypothetical protein